MDRGREGGGVGERELGREGVRWREGVEGKRVGKREEIMNKETGEEGAKEGVGEGGCATSPSDS